MPGSEPGLRADALGGFGQPAIYFDAGANTHLPHRRLGKLFSRAGQWTYMRRKEVGISLRYPCWITKGSPGPASYPSLEWELGWRLLFRAWGQCTVEEVSAVPCTVLLRQQWSQVPAAAAEAELREQRESGQPWGQLSGRDDSRSLGLLCHSHQFILLVSCTYFSHHLETVLLGVLLSV